MALRKQLTFNGVTEIKTDYGVITQGGTTVSFDAYIKVEEVRASKTTAIAIISMTDGEKRLMMTTPFSASVDTPKNTIAQAYDALKRMLLFAGATDC